MPNQAENTREPIKSQQRANQTPTIPQSHSIIAETRKPTPKYSPYVVEYNGNSDSDNKGDVKFVDIDLPCNKLSVQLLANDSNTHSKKRRVIVDTNNEIEEVPKPKTTREKKTPVKHVGIKSTKASESICSLIDCPPSDIQVILMNTNIVIPILHLFQTLPKF